MKLSILLNKSVDENATLYFEQAKKARKKLEGAKRALEISKKRAEERTPIKEDKKPQKAVKRIWYEKFRWFYTSDKLLVIGGRDATTNEIVIKKHTDKDDLVCHTHIQGSPFVTIKSEGKEISKTSLEEACVFTACVSRAWKLGMGSVKVGYVKPEQVTKEANAGEFLAHGAFMIRGKTPDIEVSLKFAVGMYEGKVMGGPLSAVRTLCPAYCEVVQGDLKPSEMARKIKSKIGGEIDDIVRALPPGNCGFPRERKK